MNKKERRKLYLKRLLTHHEKTKDRKFYAIKRIDLLIISISGAGIYITLEILRHLQNPALHIGYNSILLKSAGITFASAIVLNFISQWTGHAANVNELKSNEERISKEKGDSINKAHLRGLECKSKIFNTLTAILNIASTLTMIVGIILLIVFNFLTF